MFSLAHAPKELQIRACGAQNQSNHPSMSMLTPKIARLRRARINAFPLVYSLHNANFFSPAAGQQGEMVWNSAPQARKISGFCIFYRGKRLRFGPPQARKFWIFSRLYAFSKGIFERRRRKFWDFSPDPSVPPYDLAEIGREGGDR